MLQSKPDTPVAGEEVSLTTKDSMLRKFLEGETCLERGMVLAWLKATKWNLLFLLDLLKIGASPHCLMWTALPYWIQTKHNRKSSLLRCFHNCG